MEDFIPKSKESELCQEDKETLIKIYPQITSKFPNDKSDQEIMRDLFAVKFFLKGEAQLYNFDGVFAEVHSSIVIEDFTEFETPILVAYIDLMHYDIDQDILDKNILIEIATLLHQHQLARLENLRIHKFINNVLFLPLHQKPTEFPGILYWHDIPSFADIISRGPLYFYPRIGELTIDVLTSKFDFQELVHLAMMFGTVRNGRYKRMNENKSDILFRLETGYTHERIARAIMLFVTNAEFDPRVILTPQKFVNLYLQEDNEDTMSINQSAPYIQEDLYMFCSKEGIPLYDSVTNVRKPDDILFEEYTVVQLSPTFSSHTGDHRSPYEAFRRARTPSGAKIWDLEIGEFLFFGKRDGLSKGDAYTLKELIKSFEHTGNFYDPESIRLYPNNTLLWDKFSLIAIKRLLYKILPKMERSSEYAQRLTKVIKDILNKYTRKNIVKKSKKQQIILKNAYGLSKRQQERLINAIKLEPDQNELKMALIRIYDVGSLFFNIDELIMDYDPVMLTHMMMKDPLSNPPDPIWTGRVRAECRDLLMRVHAVIGIMSIGTRILFNKLRIFRMWDDTLYINYDDDPYTIGGYLAILFEMISLGLFKQISTSGRHLMSTANKYHHIFFGTAFTDLQLEFGESGAYSIADTGEVKNIDDINVDEFNEFEI